MTIPDYSTLQIRDVTLRDGLQLTGKTLSATRKVELIRTLLSVGIPEVEIGSMARPDLVPPMANTLDVVRSLQPHELDRCWIWVATPNHVRRGLAAGVRNVQYCLSASPAHNQANIGRDTEASVAAMPEASEVVLAGGGRIQLCIATSFTCPFTGPVPPEHVLAIACDPRTALADDIVICDTLGQATPAQVADLIDRVRRQTPQRRIIFHGHDTWGQGVANSLAAFGAGATMIDGSLAGLGGCPFAPGASGNSATEDLLFATRPSWLTPAELGTLVRAGTQLTDELGERNRSRAAEGAYASTTSFPWGLGT